MILIGSNKQKVFAFDVDDTLVFWDKVEKDVIVTDEFGDVALTKNKELINKLIKLNKKGHIIVVWSQSGVEWVEAVIKALKIEKFVTLGMTKPSLCFDDLPFNDWCNVEIIKNKPLELV